MITITANRFGDVTVDGREFGTANVGSDFQDIGVEFYREYEVDVEPLDNATRLLYSGDTGGVFHRYSLTNEKSILICKTQMRELFDTGSIPPLCLYFREKE